MVLEWVGFRRSKVEGRNLLIFCLGSELFTATGACRLAVVCGQWCWGGGWGVPWSK